jgi:hemoglobin-like flavoprotein
MNRCKVNALFYAMFGCHITPGFQQFDNNLRLIEVINASRQCTGIQQAVVAQNVVMQKVDRNFLSPGIIIKLPLTRAGKAGVNEHHQIFPRHLLNALVPLLHRRQSNQSFKWQNRLGKGSTTS